MRILVSADYYDQFLDRFKILGKPEYRWERMSWPDRDLRLPYLLTDADAVISRLDFLDSDYQSATKLKLFQVPTSGYDHINIERATRYGIYVTNNGGANAISVAEHVFMLILCIYRKLLFHHNAVINGPWVNRKYENSEMFGKRMGIIGLGNVGRQVAIRARCFGMEVAYHDIASPDPEFVQKYALRSYPFEELLAWADIVTFHVPLTMRTENMINRESLGLMKPGTVLINTSRGKIQDETALCEALSTGRLRGAGVDVFRVEPLPRDSCLLRFDNVVLTPHNGPSRETQDRVIATMVENIRRVEKGLAPYHMINQIPPAQEV